MQTNDKTPMNLPSQCANCVQFKANDGMCTIYDYLVGEGKRANITICPGQVKRTEVSNLECIASYIDADKANKEISQSQILAAVNETLDDYETKMQIAVVGIARRKIRNIIRMTDVSDRLIDRLESSVDDMNSAQMLKLLSELNSSTSNDLSLVMKLLQSSDRIDKIQAYFDQRTVVVNNNSGQATMTSAPQNTVISPETDSLADEILRLPSDSREHLREASAKLLSIIQTNELKKTKTVSAKEDRVEDLVDDLQIRTEEDE